MASVHPSQVLVSFEGIRKLAQKGVESVGNDSTALGHFTPEEKLRFRAALEAGLAELEDAQGAPGVMVAPDNGPASLIQSFLAEQAAREGKVEPTPLGNYEAKFDEKDYAGWATSVFDWMKGLQKHAWRMAGPNPEPMPAHARVMMLSDWGSGMYGAPVGAKSIERANPAPHVVLHLGDVYYSGTETEVRERFLQFFPNVPGALRRALNSNHEMYSGGYGYFDLTLPTFGQRASYFALENERWVLVGLDTGYAEGTFAEDQVVWLDGLLRRAQRKNQKVILTSHHQPYSLLGSQGPKLVGAIQEWLSGKQIFAWYWGHEHRCVLHAQHPAWGMYGRCIGHSGFPYFRDQLSHLKTFRTNPDGTRWYQAEGANGVPGALILDGPNPYLTGHENEYGPHGYVGIELRDDSLVETVYGADGTVQLQQELR